MKNCKIVIGVILSIIGCLILIIKIYNKPIIEEEIKPPLEVELDTTSTTTTTTHKTTKKTTKTTHKTTKKKVTVQKVNTAGKEEYINYAKQVGNYDDKQMSCLINLWNRESGWNPNARNKSSGACGIPQALPCSKIKNQQGSNDWKAQIRWGINYINYRYKTPCKAWNHFQSKRWY